MAKASSGRLGYVHMFDMSDAALAQLSIDLDAENHSRDGVVIDVRNNNGGFVNMYALDVFSAAELPDDDVARAAGGARTVACSASARSARRRFSSPISTHCRMRRISPRAIAR